MFKHLTSKLNPSAQRCLPRFLKGILIFQGFTAQTLYKSFGVKGLRTLQTYNPALSRISSNLNHRDIEALNEYYVSLHYYKVI
jgi:hypothetical protein